MKTQVTKKRSSSAKTKTTKARTAKPTKSTARQTRQPASAVREKPSPALALAKAAVAALEEKQGINPVILDVRGKSSITDYFVIVSGNSIPHLRAMLDEIHIRFKKNGITCYRRSDNAESGWLVLDYVDVIIQILLDENRRYYAIEDLWRDPRKE